MIEDNLMSLTEFKSKNNINNNKIPQKYFLVLTQITNHITSHIHI